MHTVHAPGNRATVYAGHNTSRVIRTVGYTFNDQILDCTAVNLPKQGAASQYIRKFCIGNSVQSADGMSLSVKRSSIALPAARLLHNTDRCPFFSVQVNVVHQHSTVAHCRHRSTVCSSIVVEPLRNLVPQPGKLCGAGDLVGILRAAVAFFWLVWLAVPPLRSGSDGEGVDRFFDCLVRIPRLITNNDQQRIARRYIDCRFTVAAGQASLHRVIGRSFIGADLHALVLLHGRKRHSFAAIIQRQRVLRHIRRKRRRERTTGDIQTGKRRRRVIPGASNIRAAGHTVHHADLITVGNSSTNLISVQTRGCEPAVQRAHPAIILFFRVVTAGKAVDRCDIGCVLINRFVFAIQHGITLICLLDRFGNQRDPVVTGFHLDNRIDQLAGPRAGSDRAEILALLSRRILDDHADRAETVVFRLCCQCACGQKPQQHDEGQKQRYHSFTHVRSIPPES